MATLASATLTKGLRLLRAIALDAGRSSLSSISAELGIPLATAHRLALSLQDEAFITPIRKGHFRVGPALSGVIPPSDGMVESAAVYLRAPLARLARRHEAFGHFGYLEDGMVTYLVKESGTDRELWTKEQGQQEAYCSAIGKVLLAALPLQEADAYLSDGPFVSLTPNTITGSEDLRRELASVRQQGIAYDRNEIRRDLFCVGVPVTDLHDHLVGGLSLSFIGSRPETETITRATRSLKRLARDFRSAMQQRS